MIGILKKIKKGVLQKGKIASLRWEWECTCTDPGQRKAYRSSCFYFMVETREYWMVYRGPSFLGVAWFAPPPDPPPFSVSKLSLFLILPVCRRSISLMVGTGWGRSRIIRRRESLVLFKPFFSSFVVTELTCGVCSKILNQSASESILQYGSRSAILAAPDPVSPRNCWQYLVHIL